MYQWIFSCIIFYYKSTLYILIVLLFRFELKPSLLESGVLAFTPWEIL